jgi:hypothetical protein
MTNCHVTGMRAVAQLFGKGIHAKAQRSRKFSVFGVQQEDELHLGVLCVLGGLIPFFFLCAFAQELKPFFAARRSRPRT